MEIVISGVGYVGLVTGVCLAQKNHNVTCVDIDEKKIEKLKRGISTIYEPGVEALIRKNCEEGRLQFTSDYVSAYSNADIVFVGVGTPEREDGSANLDYVYKVCKQVAENVKKKCLVVIKSTVPVGTNDRIERFMNANKKMNKDIEVASNPEFLSQGSAIKDTLYARRIVIGVRTKEAEKILREVYKDYNQPIVVTNRKSAEMIKYASNDFLALKISFINEIANFCDVVGADVDEVVKGMSYDPRIGDKFLKPGIGYGGSCFPKDTKALHWLANDNGFELKTIKATIEVNENQKYKLFREAKKRFKSLEGLNVAILGATFKPETDDLREAPSIPNIRRLLSDGANVRVYDPRGNDNLKKIFNDSINYSNTIEEALKCTDLVFIFTEWEEIKNIDIRIFSNLMRQPIIFDGRNCYEINKIKNEIIDYYSIGRRTVLNYLKASKGEVAATHKQF